MLSTPYQIIPGPMKQVSMRNDPSKNHNNQLRRFVNRRSGLDFTDGLFAGYELKNWPGSGALTYSAPSPTVLV